jgi:hypothetical protein
MKEIELSKVVIFSIQPENVNERFIVQKAITNPDAVVAIIVKEYFHPDNERMQQRDYE